MDQSSPINYHKRPPSATTVKVSHEEGGLSLRSSDKPLSLDAASINLSPEPLSTSAPLTSGSSRMSRLMWFMMLAPTQSPRTLTDVRRRSLHENRICVRRRKNQIVFSIVASRPF